MRESMRDLVACLSPVEVEVTGSDGLYLVRRPTLAEALSVLAAAEAVAEGDATAWPLAERTAAAWLGKRLAGLLCAGGPAGALRAMTQMLAAGLPDVVRHEGEAKQAAEKARRTSWFEVVADYATAYHASPAQVLETPWPLFIAMHAEIDRQRARRQVENAAWYAGAKTGKLDDVLRRAYGEPPAAIDAEPMTPENYERNMEAARRYRESRSKRAEA